MYHLRRLTIAAGSGSLLIFLLWLLPRVLNPTPPTAEERQRDKAWIDTSPYWVDRQACRWLGLCGVNHLRWDAPSLPGDDADPDDEEGELRLELRSLWARGSNNKKHRWSARESQGDESWEIAGQQAVETTTQTHDDQPSNAPRAVPDFVLAYAPLVHLYSGEQFWPSDIGEHLRHMTAARDNGSAVHDDVPHPLTLDNLGELNNATQQPIYLASDDDVESRPAWLHSRANIPVAFKDDEDDHSRQTAPVREIDTDRFGHQIAEGTTWYDVDREHPLQRVSDPRKIYGLEMHFKRETAEPTTPAQPKERATGPSEARAKRQRTASLRVDDDEVEAAQAEAATRLGDSGMRPDASGYSKAPAILVMVDKGSGILDAFWFFFYSYNLGQTVLGVRYGNHVGDWEHCMVRFEDGVPRALFLSEHAGGQAYAWSALEKRPGRDGTSLTPARPVIYSAVGSHAMYAYPGKHPYVLPFQMLRDVTDRGPLWDPALHNLAYFYDYVADRQQPDGAASLSAAASNPEAPTSWFHSAAPWGDALYSLGDGRQWRLFGQYHYITGPQGPKFKNLGRDKVCQTKRCRILYSLAAGKKASWYG